MSRRSSRMPRHLCFLLLLVATLQFGCGDTTARIAVILPESGPAASYGTSLRRGIELAWAQLQESENQNVNFELVFADSASNPEQARSLAETLLNDGALIIVGGATSAEALAMVPVADHFDRIVLSPSASSPELTGISSNFFRVFPSDSLEATQMANFASQTLTFKEIAVVAEEQVFGRSIQEVFAREFQRYGGVVVETLEYPPRTDDFSGLAERIVTLAPPAVYLVGFEVGVGNMIAALELNGYSGKVLTTHAFASPASLARVGAPAEGVMLTQTVFEVDSNYAHIRAFGAAFQHAHGAQPDLFAAHGYDALMVLAKALDGRNLATSEVRKGLRSITDFPGVTGTIQFDERGDVKKFPQVYIVGDDLALYNYDAYVSTQKDALIGRLDALRSQANQRPNTVP